MGQNATLEGDSAVIVSLSEAAMHMYSAAIDALPFPEDKKFHKRADVVLSGLRKLRASLAEAASSNRPSPAVIVALSGVRQRYDSLMAHAASAPGSSLGQQIYVTRIHAKLSAQEVANGAGLRDGLLDELGPAQRRPMPRPPRSATPLQRSAGCPVTITASTPSRPRLTTRHRRNRRPTAGSRCWSRRTPAEKPVRRRRSGVGAQPPSVS